MKYTAIIGGERLDIELVRAAARSVEAEVEGERYVLDDVEAVEPGVFWFRWDIRSIEVSVTPRGDGYVVSVDGRRVEAEIVDTRNALRKSAQQSHTGIVELRAPMPGKVVKVLVNEGMPVEMNQGIFVIEAMKMQNEIKSPKKGVVRKLGVKQGAAVNAGDLLAIVE